MIYETKKIRLKNGREAVLRSPSASDGTQMLEVLKRLSAETDFLLRYPEEWTVTAEQEAGYLEGLNRSQNDLMIVCTVDGEIAGNSQISFFPGLKTRHRAVLAIALLEMIGYDQNIVRAARASAAEFETQGIWREI